MLHQSQPRPPLHLVLITCSLIIIFFQNPCSAQDRLFTDCPAEGANYTSGSKFETNLKNLLLPSLISNGSSRGFFNTPSGQNPDTVYGLAQCRGDLSQEDCLSCLNDLRVVIIEDCPNKKDAFLRYENCLLRYSNADFFTRAEYGVWRTLSNDLNASDQAGFNKQMRDLMISLASSASSKPLKFDTGLVRFRDDNIYGLVQCTQDLSATDCYSCLQTMINQIDDCCSGKKGGRVVSKSCAIRYETYLFMRLLPPSLPPRSPPLV